MEIFILTWRVIFYSISRNPQLNSRILPKFFLMLFGYCYIIISFYANIKAFDDLIFTGILYDKFINYFFTILSLDFIIRLLFRKLPQKVIIPLQLMPIKKEHLLRIFIFKSLFNIYNLNWVLVFIPLLTVHKEFADMILTVVEFILVIIFIDYLSVIVKLLPRCFYFVIIVLILLLLFNQSINNEIGIVFSKLFFKSKIKSILLIFGLLSLLIISDFIVLKLFKRSNYNSDLTPNYKQFDPFNDWYYRKYYLMLFHIKLIFRNKRSLSLLISTIFLIVLSIVFINQLKNESVLLNYYFSTCLYGSWSFTVGLYLFSFESNYLHFLHTTKLNYKLYIKTKFNLLNIISIFIFIISLPFVMSNFSGFIDYLSNLLVVIGICNPLIILGGTIFSKGIDLSQSSFANSQGVDFVQMISIFFISFLHVSLLFISKTFFQSPLDIVIIFLIAGASFLLRNVLIYHLLKVFESTKYTKISNLWEQINN